MASTLQESFAAVYALLERPRIARRAVAALLVIHTLLLAYSAYVHSPTLNEPAHLVAGLSHWKFSRFDIYSCNPPLVKMVAALPVIAAGYNEDWSGFYTGTGARPEFAMGEDFVAANGERSFFLFMIARWACIPFSWIGAITCYLWARDLYGRPAGVFASMIWCFEPNILAHAALITPDAPATALGLAACYTFWHWLKTPTWTQAALTGVVLGLAELAKTTLIVFYPLWPLMWLLYRLGSGSFFARKDAAPPKNSVAKKVPAPLSSRMLPRWFLREAGMLALRMAIGLYVLNFGYGFEGTFTQLKHFHFVSDLFTGSDTFFAQHGNAPQGNADAKKVSDPLAFPTPDTRHPTPSVPNRFTDTWLGALPAPFPKHYFLGLDITQQYFENPGRPSYLGGEWRDHGWWYYYLYAAAVKVPFALWLFGTLTIWTRLTRSLLLAPRSPLSPTPDTRNPTPAFKDECILLFPAFVIFTIVSSQTSINEHFRYVLPAFPFLFIAVSQTARLLNIPSPLGVRIMQVLSMIR